MAGSSYRVLNMNPPGVGFIDIGPQRALARVLFVPPFLPYRAFIVCRTGRPGEELCPSRAAHGLRFLLPTGGRGCADRAPLPPLCAQFVSHNATDRAK